MERASVTKFLSAMPFLTAVNNAKPGERHTVSLWCPSTLAGWRGTIFLCSDFIRFLNSLLPSFSCGYRWLNQPNEAYRQAITYWTFASRDESEAIVPETVTPPMVKLGLETKATVHARHANCNKVKHSETYLYPRICCTNLDGRICAAISMARLPC